MLFDLFGPLLGPLLTASKSCVDVDIAHGRPFQ